MDSRQQARSDGDGTTFPWRHTDPRRARISRRIRWSMVVGLLLVSALPLVVLGGGAWFVFRDLAIQEALTLSRNMARAHAAAVDTYLSEQLRTVEMIARTHSLEELRDPRALRRVFEAVSEVQGNSFVDLGVIGADGAHLAYVGPYDLAGRNYRDAAWFRTVMTDGVAVSDVFMGFRQSPHSIIAVRQSSAGGDWILRATLDNRSLYALVRSLAVGRLGDVFIVNRDGVYQTPPRAGDVLARSDVVPSASREVLEERLSSSSGAVRQVSMWLADGHWLLVVRQPESEILTPVARAVGNGALIALFALLLIFVATIFVTSRLIAQIDAADGQRDLMYADLLRSAKLASLGEMATGLAHEINNPLAVMSAEHTNLADGLDRLDIPVGARAALDQSVQRCRRQVARCGDITTKMLQFGRDTGTTLAATDVGPVLREVAGLLERRARTRDVGVEVDVEPDLPLGWLDANELEQVLLNLVNNALDAVEQGGRVRLSAARDGDELVVRVSDDGCGIPAEDLDRIFQPFFTTKPVGQGTGLGLAVAYGIVGGWNGTIDAQSEVGRGTTMSIHVASVTGADAVPPSGGDGDRPGGSGDEARDAREVAVP